MACTNATWRKSSFLFPSVQGEGPCLRFLKLRFSSYRPYALSLNATALCRGVCGGIYNRRTFLSFDATALCRGRSRCCAASLARSNVNYHGTRPWHSAIQERNGQTFAAGCWMHESLMIKHELARVQQCPEDVLQPLLFVRLGS